MRIFIDMNFTKTFQIQGLFSLRNLKFVLFSIRANSSVLQHLLLLPSLPYALGTTMVMMWQFLWFLLLLSVCWCFFFLFWRSNLLELTLNCISAAVNLRASGRTLIYDIHIRHPLCPSGGYFANNNGTRLICPWKRKASPYILIEMRLYVGDKLSPSPPSVSCPRPHQINTNSVV